MDKPTIALLVGDIRDVYSNSLCKGAMRSAKHNECNLLIVPGRYFHVRDKVLIGEYQYQFQTLFSYLKDNNVDIIVACTSVVGMSSNSDSRNSLLKHLNTWGDIKVITVSGDAEGIPNIGYENSNGIKDGINFMIKKQGCKKIAMVGGPVDNQDSIERIEAYAQALRENDFDVDEKLIIHSDFTERASLDIFNLLKGNKYIDGVVFANDRMAIGGYDAVKSLNVDKQVGRDIAFLGFDNLEKDINLDPPLASVSADADRLGFEAIEMALDYYQMPKGEKIEDRILDTQLVKRESILINKDDNSSKEAQEYNINQYTDFDTYSKRTFNFVYNASVAAEEEQKERVYRKYLFFIIQVRDMYQKQLIDTENINILIRKFEELFEADMYGEIEITRMSIIVENIKNALVSAALGTDKENLVIYMSSIFYKKLSAYRALHDSDTAYRLKQLQHDIYRMTADMSGFSSADNSTFATLISKFRTVGIEHSFLYLFAEPVVNKVDDTFEMGEFMYLKAYQIDNDVVSLEDREQMIPVSDIYRHAFGIMNQKASHLVMLNLYVSDTLYGVLLCDIRYENFMSYESLIYQLSSSIRIYYLLKDNQDANKQLEDSLKVIKENNIKLDALANFDVLTGIKNRRGFISDAEKVLDTSIYQIIDRPKYIIVAFADTDGLKGINDTLGHEEGDKAIIASSVIIQKVFGNRGTIGRIGGDEFAVIFSSDNEKEIDLLKQQLSKTVADYNYSSANKFKISISVGFQLYAFEENMDIKQLLKEADKEMYHIKKKRHAEI